MTLNPILGRPIPTPPSPVTSAPAYQILAPVRARARAHQQRIRRARVRQKIHGHRITLTHTIVRPTRGLLPGNGTDR